jgi:glycine dehydrogenase subunit 2
VTGVDLPGEETGGATGGQKDYLGAHARTTPIDLPGLSEPEAMRHYVRLSQKNYAIDTGIYPLGSTRRWRGFPVSAISIRSSRSPPFPARSS